VRLSSGRGSGGKRAEGDKWAFSAESLFSPEGEIDMAKGSCLCGAVSFEVECELPAPDACHCTACRKSSGHYFASTDIPRDSLAVQGGENVTWYRSSERVRRGFCSRCGSTLFWDPLHRDWTAVAMGAFEAPTGTSLGKHIFVHEKGDYYGLEDGLPRFGSDPATEWKPEAEG
jgi:hypothetical protein